MDEELTGLLRFFVTGIEEGPVEEVGGRPPNIAALQTTRIRSAAAPEFQKSAHDGEHTNPRDFEEVHV